MEELDKMAKLYRELEASKEGLGREMAALREQVGEERVRVQTLEDSRREVSWWRYVGGGVRRVCWWRGEEGMLVEG